MHAWHLAQMASTLASTSHSLMACDEPLVSESACGYWLASRFRFDAWQERISRHRSSIERCGTSRRRRLWIEIQPTLEEILISESLTRVVAYLTRLLEPRQPDSDWPALANSVLGNHVEARHRCLNMMVFGYGFPVERAVSLNHLRRRLESFTDQLLGMMPPGAGVDAIAFDGPRVASRQRQVRLLPPSLVVQCGHWLAAGLWRDLMPGPTAEQAGSPTKWNEGIAESVLALLPPAVFDSFGLTRGRVQHLAGRGVADTSGKLATNGPSLLAPYDFLAWADRGSSNQSRRRR